MDLTRLIAERDAEMQQNTAQLLALYAYALDRTAQAAADLSTCATAAEDGQRALHEIVSHAAEQGTHVHVDDHLAAAVATMDARTSRLHHAARLGPAATAITLGALAAEQANGVAPSTERPRDLGKAAGASIALITRLHHREHELDTRDLIGDADPVQVADFLALMVLQLLKRHGVDAGQWLTTTGAAFALGTDGGTL